MCHVIVGSHESDTAQVLLKQFAAFEFFYKTLDVV